MTEIPDELALVREFVNSLDVEGGTDDLATPASLRQWMAQRGLLGDDAVVTESDVALSLSLREALRDQIKHHHDGGTGGTVPDETTRALPLVVSFDEAGGPVLVPAVDGVKGALARVLSDVHTAALRGSWNRLKICPADDCAWAFYDPSKNRSKRWCSMSVCGNRTKTRAYRARRANQ